RGFAVEQAIRLMSQSVSTLSALKGAANVWEARKERYSDTVSDYVDLIIEFLELSASDEQRNEIWRRLVATHEPSAQVSVGQEIPGDVPHARLPGEYETGDAWGRELIARVSDQYRALFRSKPIDSIVWPRELFYDADRVGQFISGPQPLAGKSRMLFFGPY